MSKFFVPVSDPERPRAERTAEAHAAEEEVAAPDGVVAAVARVAVAAASRAASAPRVVATATAPGTTAAGADDGRDGCESSCVGGSRSAGADGAREVPARYVAVATRAVRQRGRGERCNSQ